MIQLTLEEYRGIISLIGRPISVVEQQWLRALDRKVAEQPQVKELPEDNPESE